MSADKVWVRTFKTGYKQVTLKQQPFDPAPCGYDDAEYTRTDLSQASVAAALEAAAQAAKLAGPAQDLADHELTETGAERRDMAMRCEGAIRALITPTQHDALAAHVAAEVAKARAEDAAKIEVLVNAIKRLNAACDAMWNDYERLEENPHHLGQEYQLKELHVRAISEAQQALPAALAQIGAKP